MIELLVLLVFRGLPIGIEVSGDARCPTAAQVTQDLARLHPDGEVSGPIGYYASLGAAACCSGACNDAGACL